VVPTLTYGCQTWTIIAKNIKRIKTAQNSLERAMLGLRRSDRIRISSIKQELKGNVDIGRLAALQTEGP